MHFDKKGSLRVLVRDWDHVDTARPPVVVAI